MLEELKQKLKNKDYISLRLFNVFKNNRELFSSDFDLEKYNNSVLDRLYKDNKEYFESMYLGIDDNIKLDEEQIRAILADEDYALIIAGAGTGKTTTMTSKVKYLVDKKGVDPKKILVMSYTKKATMELEERIVDKFNIPACVTTFHSLGYKYIKQIFNNRKCIIIDSNDRENIFLDFFKNLFKNKEELKEITSIFKSVRKKQWFFSKFFLDNYEIYDTYDDFFNAYKKTKLKEAEKVGIEKLVNDKIYKYITMEQPKTIKGEDVRSVAEATIANFLFTHGIEYEYEKVYSEVMDDNSVYKPDFTLELGGEEVYLEYFGMDDYKYNIIKKAKEDYHKSHHNKFISLDRIPLSSLEEKLDQELKSMGFTYSIKTNEEIYNQILDNNPLSQLFPFKNLIYDCVEVIKKSLNRDEYKAIVLKHLNNLNGYEREEAARQFYYIDKFYKFYQNKLYGSEEYRFDYSDLLYYSNKYINGIDNKNVLKFKYIIIDEYQDISRDRYDLLKKTADRNNSKVFAVGDDWQSIYAFSGSRIEYIYNFNKYFNDSKMFRITNTYRNSQELIDTSGEFIMKNKSQIEKQLISKKHILDPIKFVEFDMDDASAEYEYDGEKFYGYQEYKCLEDLILRIHKDHPEHNILVLGRTNRIIEKSFKDSVFKDDIDTKITFVGHEDIDLEGMTMHKSKGLTFDEVIIIGLNKYFPNPDYSSHWLIGLFENKLLDEMIPDAEERRLFYVALTRTKNNVYLIVDKNPDNRSPFVKEIEEIINKKEEN